MSEQGLSVTSASSPVICLENISVRYRIPSERVITFKEYMIRWLQRKISQVDFWALRHISFEVEKGSVFGIIGRNGAGKSTLLKLVARVLRPTEGRIQVVGRVAPLLELGAGFHPELDGRENIYLNGAMLGYSRSEMDEKIGRIIEFSELGDFIDAPLRTYSSGMWARLGFAVATDDKPDILIVDEVLGVGDEAFQRKCAARIESYRKLGATILMVSHDPALIRSMCQQVAWLDHGQLRAIGQPEEILQAYHQSQS